MGRFNVQSSRVSKVGAGLRPLTEQLDLRVESTTTKKEWILKGVRKFVWINEAYITAASSSKKRILLYLQLKCYSVN